MYVSIIGRVCPVHVPWSQRRNAALGPALSAVRTCRGDAPCDRREPSSLPGVDVQVITWPVKAAAALAGVRTMLLQVTCRTSPTRTSPVFLQHIHISSLVIQSVTQHFGYKTGPKNMHETSQTQCQSVLRHFGRRHTPTMTAIIG